MRTVLSLLCLDILVASLTFGQIAQGPASGSITGGVVVNTNSFEDVAGPWSEGAPLAKRVHNKIEPPLLPMPANMPPPTAPEGSNYFEDPSVRGDLPPGPPPITIASFQGNNVSSGFPPDPILAVGPNHVMHLINSSFRISDKSGNTLRTISADSWFGTTISNPGAFDPKVFYDTHAHRWVMVWDNQNDQTLTAYFLVSVSDDDDPLGVWFNWALPANVFGSTPSGTWQDYESAGYDSRAYYITGRHFTFSSSYVGNAVRVLPKAQFLGSTPGPITWYDFWSLRDLFGNDVDGIRPSFVLSNPNEYYLAGPPGFAGGTYFALYRITNPLGVPAISCVHVAATAWSNAPNAGQLGGGTPIEAGGSRVRQEVIYRDSSLWFAHSIAANGGYSAVRYVRINTATNLTVEDASFGAPGFWYFYPSLAVDRDNNIGITFSRSGETQYAGAYYTWRLSTDPPGLRPTETMRPGAGNYVVLGGTRNRWGDYMGSAFDPSDMSNLWFLTEYAAATNNFAVWVQGVRFVPFPGARVASTVSSRDFGRLEANSSSDTLEIKLNNIGSTTLTISSITKSSAAYSLLNLPALPLNLTSFDSVKFKVYFRPTGQGVVNDTIRVVSNDATTPTLKISLTGKGVVIGRATAGVLYAASGPPDVSALYTINTSTGAATLLGATGLTEIQSLAIHPTTRELYGVLTSSVSTLLYRVSSSFGDALPVRTLPLPNARAMTFANDGSLYAGTNLGALYRINITTGDTTYIGTASGVIYAGLSFNPVTGKLWASVRPPIAGRDRIYTVNTTNGSATLIGTTGGGNITPSIAFDARGKLYGIKGTSTQIDTLIVIDTTSAFGVRIGPMGFSGIQSLGMRTDSAGSTGIDEHRTGIPVTFELSQNYPNPFNPTTQIRYALPVQSRITVAVYNIMGQEVARLFDGMQPAGYHETLWNGVNSKGASVASGIYLYKLEASGEGRTFTEFKKMLLLK